MRRTVTLDEHLEGSLRWFRTWRARMLERGALVTDEQSIEDADYQDAYAMMRDHAFDVALQLAAQLGDEEAAATWRAIVEERQR